MHKVEHWSECYALQNVHLPFSRHGFRSMVKGHKTAHDGGDVRLFYFSSFSPIFHLIYSSPGLAQRAWLSLLPDKGATVLFRSRICPESYEITTMLCLAHTKVFTHWERCYSASGSSALHWCCTDSGNLHRTHMHTGQETHTHTHIHTSTKGKRNCFVSIWDFFVLMGFWPE